MAQILVRNLEMVIVEKLKLRAKQSGRSLQSEARQILTQSAGVSPDQARKTARLWHKKLSGQISQYNRYAQTGQVPMKPLVIDASVAIKWFIPEQGSIEAIKLLNSSHRLIAPDIIRPEVGNILWKLYTRRLLTSEEGSQITESFLSLPIEICSESLMTSAFEIAVAAGRTVYDSLYLALAIERNAVVITADRRLTNALKNTYFEGFIKILH